jgi:cation:H+ antiporter
VCREGWSAGGATIGAPVLTLAGFLAGLAVTLAASELLARGLTRLGSKMGFSEGLLGLLGALGADAPELSSAVIAILAGAGQVGVGVVVGSNLFNLAALLGLSALIAGGVRVRRGPLLLDAAVGLAITLVVGGMVVGLLPAAGAALLAFPLAAAYALLLATPRRRRPRLGRLRSSVPQSVVEVAYEVSHDQPAVTHGSWLPVLLLPPALLGVVVGSFAMVHEALAAESWLHLSADVLGTVVLAALTSLPNLWVALHFARTDRGTALFSAAMNSNTINLLGGLVLPALFVGTAMARGAASPFVWLLDLTVLAVLPPLVHGRLGRIAAVAMIAVYLAFVGMRMAGI